MKVVTRFAPSPTGFLHIGSARTALFNWLYAKHCGGTFLLRIEDTDRKRSTQEAIDAILAGLSWLGIDWDEEPVYQAAQAGRHRDVAEELLAAGKAYKCYLSPEDLTELREKAKAEGKNTIKSPWRDRDPSEAPSGVDAVIRFKSPSDGETLIADKVQGQVRISNSQLDDLILLRSDGTPTYMLSVVVDDHDMGITHIVRGDDHLTNAARQIQLYEALGWQVPVFAHIPLIHGSDSAKLSKRHGALGVEAYKEMGYLPEGLTNYLLKLGWSHGDDEIIPRENAIEWFDLDGINKAPARLDFDKLGHVNAHYLKKTDDSELAKLTSALLRSEGREISDNIEQAICNLMPDLKDRAQTLNDLAEKSTFLAAKRPLNIDEKAMKLLKKDGARELLTGLHLKLSTLTSWTVEDVEEAMRAYAEEQGVGFGKVAQPLRGALTGTTNAPGIFEVLWALGKDEALGRIEDQMA